MIKIADAAARIREQHDWCARAAKCAFQRHVTDFDRSILSAARSAEGTRRGRGSGGRQERAAGDRVTHSFLPASLCSWQPGRDHRRNRFAAPFRSWTVQCASLIAPYTSLAARRIVSPMPKLREGRMLRQSQLLAEDRPHDATLRRATLIEGECGIWWSRRTC